MALAVKVTKVKSHFKKFNPNYDGGKNPELLKIEHILGKISRLLNLLLI